MRSLEVNQKVTCEVTLLPFDYAGFWTRLLSAFGTENAAEIGRQIGLERQSLYKWRDGINQPSLDSLIAISQTTSRSLHWLLTGHGQEYINQFPAIGSPPLENKERKIVEELASATGQTVDQVVRELLIEALETRGLMSLDEISENYGKLSDQDKMAFSPKLQELLRQIKERLKKAQEE